MLWIARSGGAWHCVIAQGLDLDGSPIPANKLELYKKVMGFEAGRQRSGVTNTMRSGKAWHCVIADRENWSKTSSSSRFKPNAN